MEGVLDMHGLGNRGKIVNVDYFLLSMSWCGFWVWVILDAGPSYKGGFKTYRNDAGIGAYWGVN
jgi:hypothetical protein